VTTEYQLSSDEKYAIINVMESQTQCLTTLQSINPCHTALIYNETSVSETSSRTGILGAVAVDSVTSELYTYQGPGTESIDDDLLVRHAPVEPAQADLARVGSVQI
jgi:hypothetical protein